MGVFKHAKFEFVHLLICFFEFAIAMFACLFVIFIDIFVQKKYMSGHKNAQYYHKSSQLVQRLSVRSNPFPENSQIFHLTSDGANDQKMQPPQHQLYSLTCQI